ncbi:hypothetical protein VTO42DRAFT_7609 [Malbranchea cinnamomea]
MLLFLPASPSLPLALLYVVLTDSTTALQTTVLSHPVRAAPLAPTCSSTFPPPGPRQPAAQTRRGADHRRRAVAVHQRGSDASCMRTGRARRSSSSDRRSWLRRVGSTKTKKEKDALRSLQSARRPRVEEPCAQDEPSWRLGDEGLKPQIQTVHERLPGSLRERGPCASSLF